MASITGDSFIARAGAVAYLRGMGTERFAAIEIPLLPSPRLRRAQLGMLALLFMHAIHLLASGHPVVACAVGAATAAGSWRPRRRESAAQVLKLSADGAFSICDGNCETPVAAMPASRRLGMHLLLVLRAPHAIHRVLLGPDNVPAARLAALLRCLPSEADAMTALHCQPLPPRNPPRTP
jgi:hypothetical protein